MRSDALSLEENRLSGLENQDDYISIHERHRIFPEVFENRGHREILDISAGVGIVGKRIKERYSYDKLVCNDISPTALKIMSRAGLDTVSFDLDSQDEQYPLADSSCDAIISLAAIEHIINTGHFVKEIFRILKPGGYFYLSSPNYAGLLYLLPVIFSGRTFHNPLREESRYEFFAHVRYFTYRTLVEYVSSFGLFPQVVYIGTPRESSKYLQLKRRSKFKAFVFRSALATIYRIGSPRLASEPVICFYKPEAGQKMASTRPRKVIL